MKKHILVVATILVCAIAPAQAQFKFELPSLGSKPSVGETAATPPSGDALVTTFQQSQASVLIAQSTLAEALGLKDQAMLAQAEVKRLSSGQLDLDGMKKNRELSDGLQLDIAARMATQPQLTADARAKFSTGLFQYLQAVAGARNLLVQSQQYFSSVGANPMAVMGKAKSALWVGKETPGYVKGLVSTSKVMLEYAKRNAIKTPANATAELDGL